jgi:hypothetical protein
MFAGDVRRMSFACFIIHDRDDAGVEGDDRA